MLPWHAASRRSSTLLECFVAHAEPALQNTAKNSRLKERPRLGKKRHGSPRQGRSRGENERPCQVPRSRLYGGESDIGPDFLVYRFQELALVQYKALGDSPLGLSLDEFGFSVVFHTSFHCLLRSAQQKSVFVVGIE